MGLLLRDSVRNVYFVRQGTHKGDFLVEVDRIDGNKVFLALPDKNIHTIPIDDFNNGVKNKILDIVEKLPRSVYNVCKKEYKLLLSEQKYINSNN